MSFKMIHENYNVSDLDRSIKFYREALDLYEVRRITNDNFIIVYLTSDASDFELELTWLKDHPQPYNLGECEFHLAFKAMTLRKLTKSMRKWDASALKILKWEFISSKILTDIGLKFYHSSDIAPKRYRATNSVPFFVSYFI